MRRAILVSLIILLSQPLVSAIEISSNTEENSGGTLSGNYTVKNGSTWTISGDYEIEDETSIIIEKGATMIVSGAMNSTQTPQLDLAASSDVIVPVNNIGATGFMKIHFAQTVVYPINISINNESWNFSDDIEFDWNGSMDVDNITINITNNLFQQADISHITLSPSGSSPVIIGAEMLSGEGTSLIVPHKQGAWSIDVQGELIITGSIFGCAITCHGKCSLNEADMRSSGPIEVYGEIDVTDSVFDNGFIDEDIIIWDDAIVSWENSTGTGGDTDYWVNILSTRTMGVGNSYVWFQGFEMGYNKADTSQLRDNSTFDPNAMGDNVIEIGETKLDRIVRWQDGNGVIHQESAYGKIVLATPWGIYEKQITEIPRVNHFDVDLDLPLLNFDSLVESKDNSDINTRLGVMATVTNTGSAPANFRIPCTTNGTDANVGLTLTSTIAAGETIEIPMNWDSPNEGDFILECSIFVPVEFEGFDVVSKETASTNPVTWSEADEEESSKVGAITLGIVVSVGLFAVIFWRGKQVKASKDYTLHSENEDGLDDEVGTIE